MNNLQRLVTNRCANHDKNGKCLLEVSEDDNGEPCRDCPLFSEDDKRCLYFETAVLPEEPKLERRYWEERGVVYENLSKCEQCGDLYKRRSNAQKYCDDCSEFNRKLRRSRQNRKYYRRRKATGSE